MAKNKTEAANREGNAKVLTKLAEVRSGSEDMAAKRRLRDVEEKLAVAAPVTETDVSFIDKEILRLLDAFPSLAAEGVLTERYLERIETLSARRRTQV